MLAPEAVLPPTRRELEDLEMRLLLEAIYERYGFDFRGYARGSLRRRLWSRALEEGATTLSALQDRVLHDPVAMERLLSDLSVTVTAMFRDPMFYRTFRSRVVPLLRTYPFIRIWNAGCSTGEETYSMAILLREEGLSERSRIYATDMNHDVLEKARSATLPLARMRVYTQNYIGSGGKRGFSEYYTTEGQNVYLDRTLLDNVVIAQHNLVSDQSFNEFHVILCRNVMIYFGKELQRRVHDLLHESLVKFGVLALGRRESVRFTRHEQSYEVLDGQERIYRRVE
jgi:chemotaxis protein methyltransferase CheR